MLVQLDHLPSAGESTRMEIQAFRQFRIGEVTLREIVVEIYENPTKETNDLLCNLSMQYIVICSKYMHCPYVMIYMLYMFKILNMYQHMVFATNALIWIRL